MCSTTPYKHPRPQSVSTGMRFKNRENKQEKCKEQNQMKTDVSRLRQPSTPDHNRHCQPRTCI